MATRKLSFPIALIALALATALAAAVPALPVEPRAPTLAEICPAPIAITMGHMEGHPERPCVELYYPDGSKAIYCAPGPAAGI